MDPFFSILFVTLTNQLDACAEYVANFFRQIELNFTLLIDDKILKFQHITLRSLDVLQIKPYLIKQNFITLKTRN